MFKFKPGDRILYTARVSGIARYKGKIGTVQKAEKGWEGDNRYVVTGEVMLSACKEINMELVGPAFPLEESLIAYIEQEKKELGLA